MTTDTMEAPQPARSRAVFSQEDFGLIRTAIAHYLKEVQDQPESVKYANLYHRLGRVALPAECLTGGVPERERARDHSRALFLVSACSDQNKRVSP